MRPPADQPQTFKDTNPADDSEIEREALRDIRLDAPSEAAARILVERQAFDLATQEVAQSGEFSDEQQSEAMEAVMNRQWVVDKIEEVDAPAAPAAEEPAPAE